MDSIKKVTLLDTVADDEEYQMDLTRNLPKVFGVSFGNSHVSDTIKLTLYINEHTEKFILDRLRREGQEGTITHVGENRFTYEKEVFDGNEMIPWIRTFTGRIISFESNNNFLVNKFYGDMRRIAAMYDE